MKVATEEGPMIGEKSFRDFFRAPENGSLWTAFAMKDENGAIYGAVGACHAQMNMMDRWYLGKKPVTYYSLLRNFYDSKVPKETVRLYWDTILNEDTSPWRVVLKNTTVYEDKGLPYAFSVDIDKTTSSQVLVNLSVAARLPFEHPNRMVVFNDLIQQGVDPLKAIFSLVLATSRTGGRYYLSYFNEGHFPFNHSDMSWDVFKKGEPRYIKYKTIQNKSDYFPNNSIWSTSPAVSPMNTFIQLLKKETKPKDEPQGMFKRPPQLQEVYGQEIVSASAFIEAIKGLE